MQVEHALQGLAAHIERLDPVRPVGRVNSVSGGLIEISGVPDARIGQQIRLPRRGRAPLTGEIVRLENGSAHAMPDQVAEHVSIGDRVTILPAVSLAPSDSWKGRVIDPNGKPLDGKPLLPGVTLMTLQGAPPAARSRMSMGRRLDTGLAVTNTFLPIVSGQRLGLFANAGLGKSSLIAMLAQGLEADVVVIALIGERGHEVSHFTDSVLGPEAMQRCVVVAATSDQPALHRRRCAWSAMTVAEYFRAQGKNVLLLADSMTRFADAHREVASAAGELPVLRGYPASVAPMLMSLCERAGPGPEGEGHITGLFSVLVPGEDMDEPISDILRGTLDGHIILGRDIAARGRFPAIDVLQSVSRSLPGAASDAENALLSEARRLLSVYDTNAAMIRAGLYSKGTDAEIDRAIAFWPEAEAFLARQEAGGCEDSFKHLELALRRSGRDR